eukprot:7377750-Prymnesium_polylepis.1
MKRHRKALSLSAVAQLARHSLAAELLLKLAAKGQVGRAPVRVVLVERLRSADAAATVSEGPSARAAAARARVVPKWGAASPSHVRGSDEQSDG